MQIRWTTRSQNCRNHRLQEHHCNYIGIACRVRCQISAILFQQGVDSSVRGVEIPMSQQNHFYLDIDSGWQPSLLALNISMFMLYIHTSYCKGCCLPAPFSFETVCGLLFLAIWFKAVVGISGFWRTCRPLKCVQVSSSWQWYLDNSFLNSMDGSEVGE